MNKKIKTIIAVGGTGGHVFPGCNLALHLIEKNYDVRLITDNRGNKFLKSFKNLNISIISSSPISKKNLLIKFYNILVIIYSVLRSLFFLIFNRPSIIFGMGGYSSFPICIAARFLKIKFFVYENNLIIGKANKYLLPFAEKILVSFKEVEGVPEKYKNKVIKVGNIINKKIIDLPNKNFDISSTNNFNLLILGGSQAAKIFAEKLPKILNKCSKQGVKLKIYQQCLPSQNEDLRLYYEKNNIKFETFNFSENLNNYFSKVNLAITRSGSSMLAELTHANIPFIAVPLPTSADNHQLKNGKYYKNKKLSFLIEEKDLEEGLQYLLEQLYKNRSLLKDIITNQRQFSDKNVYNNIDQILKEMKY